MLSEQHAFLEEIRRNSNDNTCRLAFADWLEERGAPGDVRQAVFIRNSIDPLSYSSVPTEFLILDQSVAQFCHVPFVEFVKRERSVLIQEQHFNTVQRYLYTTEISDHMRIHITRDICFIWDRGFLNSLTVPYRAWLDYGPLVFGSHAIQSLSIVGKNPRHDYDAHYGNYFEWFPCRPGLPLRDEMDYHVIDSIYGMLPRSSGSNWRAAHATYSSPREAIGALGEGCYSWAESVHKANLMTMS